MSRQYTLQHAARSTSIHIDYAAELNEQPLACVTATPGPLLVIAGAGSGKTRTLTYRVADLLENGIDPRNILLLTFTNNAAPRTFRSPPSRIRPRARGALSSRIFFRATRADFGAGPSIRSGIGCCAGMA